MSYSVNIQIENLHYDDETGKEVIEGVVEENESVVEFATKEQAQLFFDQLIEKADSIII